MFRKHLADPVDAASVAAFRLAFGIAMTVECIRYMQNGWFRKEYLGNAIHFSYPGFSWIHALPHPSAGALEWTMILAAIGIAAGVLYRLSATLFFAAFTFVFLYEQTQYLNHFYLISLLGLLLIFVPAHRVFSLDAIIGEALRKRNTLNNKCIRFFFPDPSFPYPRPFIPAWGRNLLLFQISIPYVYGGIAKLLTPDWMLGYPMRFWLDGRSDLPVIGRFTDTYGLALFMSWAGMLFDLSIVPLILWKRTRWAGVALMLAFNLMNMRMFQIGIFPWLMIASIPLFFDADWPRRLWDAMTLRKEDRHALQAERDARLATCERRPLSNVASNAILAFALFQLLFPLRHVPYAGPVQWTGEGGLFSWHMKLSDRRGYVEFRVTDRATGKTETIDPRPFLSPSQRPEMATHPDVILQFARVLADERKAQGKDVAVYADAYVSLNGRKMRRLIDPKADLSQTNRILFGHAPWILPLTEPLPDDPKALSEEGGSADE